MMLRVVFAVLSLVALSQSADHNTFKNCSENPLCSNLRSKELDDSARFTADLSTFGTDDNGAAHVTLQNSDQNLILTLQFLNADKYRLTIEEEDSKRYRLKDVLNGEPVTSFFERVDRLTDSVVLSTQKNDSQVILTGNPFSLEFRRNNLSEVIFDNERLVFEKNSSNFAFQVTYPEADTLYGLHEHADNLTLQNTGPGGVDPYRLRNLDVSGYELNSPMAVYGAVPVVYGHGYHATAGTFLHNAAEQWIEITKNVDKNSKTYTIVESGLLDLFILLGPTPKEVVRQYTSLTGVAHLPQFWALGYHQCRWSYDNQSDVKNVIANMDNANFPMDVIWLDIDYTNGKRYFTWNPDTFDDPLEMQQNISSTNRKLVTIIDPHIKIDPDYSVYSGALEKDLFVKNSDGSNFEGECWPGQSSYMDFLNPKARDFYASMYSFENFPNTTPTLAGIWNDMNEPSVFDDSLEKTIPGDALQFENTRHRDVHNIYGLLHTKATHQGLIQRESNKRPFVLTRSHFAGTQRYALIWTGDNAAEWGHLAISYSQCLNANILGLVFCGADIGGFAGNPSEELLQRWYQAGAWLPFYRGHASQGSDRREPYLYSEEVQQVIRSALQQRYQHLYVWYTLFFKHTQSGDPIIRPLFYHYPQDSFAGAVDFEVLVGKDILVRPVTEPEVSKVFVYLPGKGEIWYRIDGKNQEVYSGQERLNLDVDMNSIPVFYRGGGIIPLKKTLRASSEDMKEDHFHLVVNLNEDKKAEGYLYWDDYESFDYTTNQYILLRFTYDNGVMVIYQVAGDIKISEFIHSIEIHEKVPNSTTYKTTVFEKDALGRRLSDISLDGQRRALIQL